MNTVLNILKDVIDNAEYKIKISSVVTLDAPQYELFVSSCTNILWLRECLIIQIEGLESDYLDYKIVSIADDKLSFIVEGHTFSIPNSRIGQTIIGQAIASEVLEVDVPEIQVVLDKPTFVHGTVQSSNIIIRQDCINLPIVYFYEMFESRKMPMDNPIDYIVNNARLFFVTDCENSNWVTTDFYKHTIEPMNNLLDFILKELSKDTRIEAEYILKTGYKTINREKIGKTGNSNKNVTFDRMLSGVECVINLPIKKIDCKC